MNKKNSNKKIVLISIILFLTFIITAGFFWFRSLSKEESSVNTIEIPDTVTQEKVEVEPELIEVDAAGLEITNSLRNKLNLNMGFIWSDHLEALNQEIPVEIKEKNIKIESTKKNLIEYKNFPFEVKRLKDLVAKPEKPEKTNWLSFPNYNIEAPLVFASFQDFFEQDPSKPKNIVEFTKPIQEDKAEIARGNYESVPVQKLLRGGVVHLPFSTYPGELGHSFIVGHSSNFSSVESNYNTIFKPIERTSKPGDIFYIYDYEGRKMKFEIFEAIEILEADVNTAYRNFPNNEFPDKDRVVTLQGSILETVNGRLEPTKRWLTRGQLVLE
jgi:Sortase domain